MPAASDSGSGRGASGDTSPVELPRTWRPLGLRLAGLVFGGALLAVCVAAWFAFTPETRAKFTAFQIGTLWALGGFIFGAMYTLARSRVTAEADRLVVVNGFRRRTYDWAEVVAVQLPPGAPWLSIDLADGRTVSALAIQGSDGLRARRAVQELRALVDRPR